jgi:hypothetical protein
MLLETDTRVVATLTFPEHLSQPSFALVFDCELDKDIFFGVTKALAETIFSANAQNPNKVRAIRHLRSFSNYLLVSAERLDVAEVHSTPPSYKLSLYAAKLLIEAYL